MSIPPYLNGYPPQPGNYYMQPEYSMAGPQPMIGCPNYWNQSMPASNPPLPNMVPPPPPPLPPPGPQPTPPPPPSPKKSAKIPSLLSFCTPAPVPKPPGPYPNGSWAVGPMNFSGGYDGGPYGGDQYNQQFHNGDPGPISFNDESDFIGDTWQQRPTHSQFDNGPPNYSYPNGQQTEMHGRNPTPNQNGDAFVVIDDIMSETPCKNDGQKRSKQNDDSFIAIDDVMELDDDDQEEEDWHRCQPCQMDFDNSAAYQRHCRGLIHTQKVMGQSASQPQGTEAASSKPSTSTMQNEVKASPNVDKTESSWTPSTSDPNQRDLKPTDVGKHTGLVFCEVCKISCSVEASMQAHLEGQKHLKMLRRQGLEANVGQSGSRRGSNPISHGDRPLLPTKMETYDSAEDTGRPAFIQKKIDEHPGPFVGLQYVVEYVMNEFTEPRYVCNLCEAKGDPRNLITHLLGYQHRKNYFLQKEIRSDIYAEIYSMPDGMQKSLLADKSREVERAEGRAKVRQKCEGGMANKLGRMPVPIKATIGRPLARDRTNRISEPMRPPAEPVFMDDDPDYPISSEGAQPDEKTDYPYYSVRAQRGHVRVTDESDDFYIIEQGYWYLRHSRDHTRYDDVYVKPYIGEKKNRITLPISGILEAPKAAIITSGRPNSLMAALDKVSTDVTLENGKKALALSNMLTQALIKLKEAKKQAEAQKAQAVQNVTSELRNLPLLQQPYALSNPTGSQFQTTSNHRHSSALLQQPYPSGPPFQTVSRHSESTSMTTVYGSHPKSEEEELLESAKRRHALSSALAAANNASPPKRKLGAGYKN